MVRVPSSIVFVCLPASHYCATKFFVITNIIITSNNQRLESAGDNDRRSERFCSNAVLCVSFT